MNIIWWRLILAARLVGLISFLTSMLSRVLRLKSSATSSSGNAVSSVVMNTPNVNPPGGSSGKPNLVICLSIHPPMWCPPDCQEQMSCQRTLNSLSLLEVPTFSRLFVSMPYSGTSADDGG